MEKFPRGTLPPSAYVAMIPGNPAQVAKPPTTIVRAVHDSQTPRGTCDLSVTCPTCSTLMQPEHAHYRCGTCGYRDSCCF
ncbi:hypothetical protein BH11MYX3_BH11MYX3_23250 [soil metagenome]